jgi:uncharacterized protein (DUF1501 family)
VELIMDDLESRINLPSRRGFMKLFGMAGLAAALPEVSYAQANDSRVMRAAKSDDRIGF